MITPIKAAIAALLLVGVTWLIWPSPYGKVKNLESGATSIVAFGDSLTAGYGAASGEDYPSKLAARIGKPVENAGLSGETTEGALARIDADVLSRSPRVVIVGLGGNDFLRGVPLATSEANLRSIVRRIQGRGAMVILLGFQFPSLKADYEEMYERVAADEGCLLVPDTLDGILNNPKLKSDEIHPNAAGYDLMAERIAGPCAKLLEKADEARE